jgi:hypothetical protein
MHSLTDERSKHNPDQELDLTNELIEEVRKAIDVACPADAKSPSQIARKVLDAYDPNGVVPLAISAVAYNEYRETAADLLAKRGLYCVTRDGNEVYVPWEQLTEEEAMALAHEQGRLNGCEVSLRQARAIVRNGEVPAIPVDSIWLRLLTRRALQTEQPGPQQPS